MKAQHRHELKTNELAEWLTNLPQWAKQHRTTIIYVSVLAVVVLGVYFWKKYQKNVVSVQKQLEFTQLITRQLTQNKMQTLQARAQGVDISYMLIQVADRFQTFAQNAKNDQMAVLALIKRAEALRAELHYRMGTVDDKAATEQINQAKAAYTEAIAKSTSNPSLTAKAKFGLGLCEEEIGNFEKAAQIYNEIVANPDFEATTAFVQAKQRLDTVTHYKQKLVFRAAPKPPPVQPIQPQLKLTPVDTNAGPAMQNNAIPYIQETANELSKPPPSQ